MTSHAWSPFFEAIMPTRSFWKSGPYQLVQCEQSGLIYLANPPTEAELQAFYAQPYFEGDALRRGYASYTADEAVLRQNFHALVNIVRQAAFSQNRSSSELDLLDYGCAYGYFLDEARPHFASVRGIEINPEVAKIGQQRFGVSIRSGIGVLAQEATASADIITLWDVIEHLTHPRSALLDCARILRPGGQLHISTGDLRAPLARLLGPRWRLINPPQHICYFSNQTLPKLLEACGFDVVAIHHRGKRVSLGFAWFILQYLLGRKASSPPVHHAWMRFSIYLNLFDVMQVVALRRDQALPLSDPPDGWPSGSQPTGQAS